jgi:hypothetical protein
VNAHGPTRLTPWHWASTALVWKHGAQQRLAMQNTRDANALIEKNNKRRTTYRRRAHFDYWYRLSKSYWPIRIWQALWWLWRQEFAKHISTHFLEQYYSSGQVALTHATLQTFLASATSYNAMLARAGIAHCTPTDTIQRRYQYRWYSVISGATPNL